MPWYVRARMLLIISRTLARPSIFTLLMVLFAGTLVAGPAFCIPSSISSSNRIDMRIDIEMFFVSFWQQRKKKKSRSQMKKTNRGNGFLFILRQQSRSITGSYFSTQQRVEKDIKKERCFGRARCFNFLQRKSTGQSSFPSCFFI